jgi:hypothetical protein
MSVNYIDPTREQIKRFAQQHSLDAPILMLNLVRYREVAQYEPSHPLHAHTPPLTGKEAYRRYRKELEQWFRKTNIMSTPSTVVFEALPQVVVTGPANEQWDEMFVVRYENARVFLAMIKDAEYKR